MSTLNIDGMKVIDLKDQLRNRNLPLDGNKAQLVLRLREAVKNEEDAAAATTASEATAEQPSGDAAAAAVDADVQMTDAPPAAQEPTAAAEQETGDAEAKEEPPKDAPMETKDADDESGESAAKKRRLDEAGTSTSESTGEGTEAVAEKDDAEATPPEAAAAAEGEAEEEEEEDDEPLDEESVRKMLGDLAENPQSLLDFAVSVSLDNMESPHLLKLYEDSKTDPNKCKIFVRSLHFNTDDAKLKEVFAKYGTVREAIVIKEKGSQRSKGFGFVTFATVKQAAKALAASKHKIDGRMTYCSMANSKDAPRGGGGGGRRDDYRDYPRGGSGYGDYGYGGYGGYGGGGYGGYGGGGYGGGGYGGYGGYRR